MSNNVGVPNLKNYLQLFHGEHTFKWNNIKYTATDLYHILVKSNDAKGNLLAAEQTDGTVTLLNSDGTTNSTGLTKVSAPAKTR